MENEITSINVGLLGAANITRLVWASIHRAGHKVTLIGVRDPERGAAFVQEVCDELNIPNSADHRPRVTTYDEVVSSPNVDLVYIPIPVTTREAWVKKCVENGKHVVGEKPPAASAEQLREWIEALDAKELLYMDGTMFSHGKRVELVSAAARTLGPIKHMHSNHCLNAPPEFFEKDIRMDPSLEPHGALGDMGWYSIRYFLHVMDQHTPTSVTGRIIKTGGEKGAIVQFSGELTFEVDGHTTIASLFTSFDGMDEQTLTVAGTEAVLRVKDMCHPVTGSPAAWTITREKTSVRGCRWEVERDVQHYSSEDTTESQRDDMWRDVGRIIYRNAAGKLVAREEQRRYWSTLAWKTQAVMDKMLNSANALHVVAV
ncbi:oxidoreductase-like protein [Trypanosoma theileri]|uniref:Oxidoreductase-like protein n=1 Tax=Trypanosoma theileri TaxID=67003 RepID=A0A1X0NX10_9TRYP|nr:oxidoreductase-like protein [Trypanosoma theileri]ORC89225.1 oxidoreductase-like protein [Trypanosoma theileri]